MARSSSAHSSTSHGKSGSTRSGSSSKEKQKGHLSRNTTDHDEIRRWAEARGGKPACVQGTGGKGDVGLLRIEFPGSPGAKDDKLQPIEWEEFFEKFDERGLALVYQDHTADGKKSNFNKLVERTSAAGSKARTAG
jgi:hypothetical protein